MKIAVGSIQQETNSFSPIKPTEKDFFILRGEEMISQIAVTSLFKDNNVLIIPTIYAHAVPSGQIEKDDYIKICDELINALPDDGDLDGIWLYCHGAMNVDEIGSGELFLIKKIREKVGFDIPVSMVLDFHANIDVSIVKYVNAICGYKTAPHTDMEETQIFAGKVLLRCIREKLLPRPQAVKIPMMISGDKVLTEQLPMREIIDMAKTAEKNPEILVVSVFHGHNWVDVENAGSSVIVTAVNNINMAKAIAQNIAEYYWSIRDKFNFQIPVLEPQQAIEQAFELSKIKEVKKPIFISDSGDNTTAGAAGDRIDILKLLLKNKTKKTLVGGIADKNVVNELWGVPNGYNVKITLGGTYDKKSGHIEINAILKNKDNILGWDGEDGGKAAVVSVDDIDIIITNNRCSFISPEIFNSIGIDIYNYDIIVVKLGYLYPELAKAAYASIIALTDGNSTITLEKLDFKNIKKVMYPFNKQIDWSAYND
ncbi:MAG: MlrC protein [Clostridia bacterium]|nr:MlrC protein [Clostridia bacterium]